MTEQNCRLIDTHTHLHYSGRLPDEMPGISAHQLVDTMNRYGIEKSVVLPMESPEYTSGYCLTDQVILAAELYPERIIPFIHVDPRKPRCLELIEHFARHPLVKGFGEFVDSLVFDHPLRRRIYGKCGDLGLPVIFYGAAENSLDEVGLPRLERCLKEFSDTIFIGHGPRWWNAISADDDAACGYPDKAVAEGGAADRFLQEYDNMYADLSANSGYNAMNRDPVFTRKFIERNFHKLLFATDYLAPGNDMKHVRWMHETDMDNNHRAAIAGGNAIKLLNIQ